MRKNSALIITAMFIKDLSRVLQDSSSKVFTDNGYEIRNVEVNGLWEVPYTINNILNNNEYDCVVVNGFIIGGRTTPYSNNMSLLVREKILQLSIKYNTPIGQAIIESETIEDAKNILNIENRKNEGEYAAIAMIDLNKKLA